MKIWLLIIASVLSSILYRMGGSDKWNTKWRDLGCPTLVFFVLWMLFGFHWIYFLIFGLMFAALTTYYDTIFGYDNFFAHGAGVGLATLPLLFIGVHWYSILIYTVVLSLGMGFSEKLKISAVAKELIRGALIIIGILLLTI